ncbi:MAG: hypothetical protein SFV19_06535 [Rhodospirillaceae bacterium]|nr:hypothetical protein [Rhodospirillaceae bacterium]
MRVARFSLSTLIAVISLSIDVQALEDVHKPQPLTACAELQPLLERARCLDPKVAIAEDQLSRALELFRERLQPIFKFDESPLYSAQAYIQKAYGNKCILPPTLNERNREALECLRNAYEAEAKRMIWSHFSDSLPKRTVRSLIADDSDSKRVCELALNVKYEVVDPNAVDGTGRHFPVYDYRANDPPEVVKIPSSSFAKPSNPDQPTVRVVIWPGQPHADIYLHFVETTNYTYTWFVAVLSDDSRGILKSIAPNAAMMRAARVEEQLKAKEEWERQVLRNAIRRSLPTTRVQVYSYLTNESSNDSAAPILYDAANTDVFDGASVEQEMIIVDNVAYIRAYMELQNFNDPTVAIFRFGTDGELLPLCWEKFSRSRELLDGIIKQ